MMACGASLRMVCSAREPMSARANIVSAMPMTGVLGMAFLLERQGDAVAVFEAELVAQLLLGDDFCDVLVRGAVWVNQGGRDFSIDEDAVGFEAAEATFLALKAFHVQGLGLGEKGVQVGFVDVEVEGSLEGGEAEFFAELPLVGGQRKIVSPFHQTF